MNGARQVRLGLVLVVAVLALAALVQSAPETPPAAAQIAASPVALTQTLIGPASADVAPGTAVAFAFSTFSAAGPAGAILPATGWVEASNQSDKDATVADDGQTLTIGVPEGYIVVPDAACAPIDGDPSTIACPHSLAAGQNRYASVSFTTVSSAAAAPLPQTVSVPSGGAATLIADEGLTQAAVIVQAGPTSYGGSSSAAFTVSWNGATVSIHALPSFTLTTVGDSENSCTPSRRATASLACQTPAGRSAWISISSDFHSPSTSPPPHMIFPTPAPQPQASPAGPYIGAAGQPIEMTAGATVCCGDAITGEIWSFGDGALASGDDVTHAYTQPGVYTVSLHVSAQYASRDLPVTAIVFPGDTTPALLDTITQPGSTKLPPGSAVSFNTLDPRLPAPATPVPDVFKTVLLANLSEQSATVSDDGSLARVQVPDGYALQLLPLGGEAEQRCQYGNEPRPTSAPPPTTTTIGPYPPTPEAPTPLAPLVATNDTHASYAICPAGANGVRQIAFTTIALNSGQ